MYLNSKDLGKRYSIFPLSHTDLWDYYKKYSSEFANIFPSGIWAQQGLYFNTHKEYYA